MIQTNTINGMEYKVIVNNKIVTNQNERYKFVFVFSHTASIKILFQVYFGILIFSIKIHISEYFS